MMRYYLPEGKRSIHGIGVEPDVSVRERILRGSLYEKVARVRRGKALAKYVKTLLKEHSDKSRELAVRRVIADVLRDLRAGDLDPAR